MIALITSSGRHDLLKQTLTSFRHHQQFEGLKLVIHEDAVDGLEPEVYMGLGRTNVMATYTPGLGQHKSIELFCKNMGQKCYLHLEDDWEFKNTYNWIAESLMIMQADPKVIKVLAREGSPHPCVHDQVLPQTSFIATLKMGDEIVSEQDLSVKYGYIQPWTSADNIKWHGFSWNPGVTRLDLLKQFMPFPKWEQDLAEQIYNAGYKVVELAKPVYKHIGDGRSTH